MSSETTFVGTVWTTYRAGPDRPPTGASTLRLTIWGGGVGTVWQLGARLGTIWSVVPSHGDCTPPPASSRTFCTEELARRHFEKLRRAVDRDALPR